MTDLYYPIIDIDITSFFGNRSDPHGSSKEKDHYGLDFKVPDGTDIMASADGIVIWTGYSGDYEHIDEDGKQHYNSGFGNSVLILHKDGYITNYAHLQDYNVEFGQTVKQGEIIAHSGNAGGSTAPHLHFEVIDGNVKSNDKTIKDKIIGAYGTINERGTNSIGIKNSEGRLDQISRKTITELKSSGLCHFYNYLNQTNQCYSNSKRRKRETIKSKYYIWHTQKDNKVRSSHAHLDGTIHSIDEDIFPGEEYGCRCWAEEIVSEL